MNIKKKLFLTAGLVASFNTPTIVAQSDTETGFDIVAILGTMSTELIGTTIGLLPMVLDGVTNIIQDIGTNGFNLDNIISGIVDIGLNVAAQVTTAFSNVAFEALAPQISEMIQGLVVGFDPTDAQFLFGGEWKDIADKKTNDCSEVKYKYKLDKANLGGFSKAIITELKINDQNYDGGDFYADVSAGIGDLNILVDFEGTVKKEGCNKEEEKPFTAAYKKFDVDVGLDFIMNASVNGRQFEILSATFSKVTFTDTTKTVDGDSPFDEVHDELMEKLRSEVDTYVDLLKDSTNDVSYINDQILELGLLPFGLELPFDFPF